MPTSRIIVALLFLLVLPAGCAGLEQRDTAAAGALTRDWCTALTRGREDEAEALMTAPLRRLVREARVADARFRAASPGDKPPLGDGLRLAAFPDGHDRCTPEAVGPAGATLAIEPAGRPDAAWRDRLEFRREADGRLLVSDIRYAPDGTERFSDWLRQAAGS